MSDPILNNLVTDASMAPENEINNLVALVKIMTTATEADALANDVGNMMPYMMNFIQDVAMLPENDVPNAINVLPPFAGSPGGKPLRFGNVILNRPLNT